MVKARHSARERSIYRTTIIGLVMNLLLSAGKFVAGLLGFSGAMVADAIHSTTDFATDAVVLAFVRVSAKPKDESHDYGHGKYETLATIIVGLVIFAVGIGILVRSIEQIQQVIEGEAIARPGLIALIAASVSILAKEALFRYTHTIGKRVNSPLLIANAWHHRSDAFSSIATLVGIGGAYTLGQKWSILDPLAAIAVSLLIAKVAYDLVIPGINELLERSLPQEVEDEIVATILEENEISDPHNLRTRRIGANIAIDVHVRMLGTTTVLKAHNATERIEKRLQKKYGEHTLVNVHVEPIKINETND